jgi:hypothetical protein
MAAGIVPGGHMAHDGPGQAAPKRMAAGIVPDGHMAHSVPRYAAPNYEEKNTIVLYVDHCLAVTTPWLLMLSVYTEYYSD